MELNESKLRKIIEEEMRQVIGEYSISLQDKLNTLNESVRDTETKLSNLSDRVCKSERSRQWLTAGIAIASTGLGAVSIGLAMSTYQIVWYGLFVMVLGIFFIAWGYCSRTRRQKKNNENHSP